jgi:FG-GAP-like repeat
MRKYFPLLVTLALAPSALAQQFQVSATALPAQAIWTDGVAIADLDADGDNDIVFANGSVYGGTGTAGAQPQHLYLNNGTGTFVAAHAQLNVITFNAKMVIAEDFDNDGDLDLMFASGSTGSPPRLLLNNGAAVFTDVTASNIPALALRSYSVCAGDVDDDGDLDVVVTDGGTFGGIASQARLLINNGAASFTDATATRMPVDLYNCQDVTLFDFDGDLDLDIALSGKGSGGLQARLYLNNGTGFFSINTVMNGVGTGATYEADYGDLDGDLDLDAMVQSISGQSEGWARNDGTGVVMPEVIFGGTNGGDDNEMAGFDYDNDGDLDVFVGSLAAGGEKVYQNNAAVFTNAAGVIQVQGDSTLDFGFGDLNGDNRYDMVTAQGESGNFTNKVYLNSGTVDNVRPIFLRNPAPAAIGASGTRFFCQTQDSIQDDGKAWTEVTYEYTLFGPTVTCGSGTAYHQGGGQFRAVVPSNAQTVGIQLFWRAVDPAGNARVSPAVNIGNLSPWRDLGSPLAGVSGNPVLTGVGNFAGGSNVSVNLTNGAPNAGGFLVIGGSVINIPLLGGTLVPAPDVLLPFSTNGSGVGSFTTLYPAGKPDCVTFYFQVWLIDAAGPQGVSASNGLSGTQPAGF